MTQEYSPAVAGLLQLGEIDPRAEWLDYRARGVGAEHVPELVRLLRDEELVEDLDAPESWGPIHAFRALGQLGAVEAVGDLLEVRDLHSDSGGSWLTEEFPGLMARIGPPALPALAANLADAAQGLYARWNSAESIARIGEQHPATRDECVALLTQQLERLAEEGEDETGDLGVLRGGVIGTLLDLKAVEAAPLIERVFATCYVDETIAGDWEEARFELGLGPPPQRRTAPTRGGGTGARSPKDRAKERSREKRKAAKQSKKRNRKK